MQPTERVIVLDYGSQYNLLIVRRLREAGVYSELHDHEKPWADYLKPGEVPVRAVILSGGPASVYQDDAPGLPDGLLQASPSIPILGICYGMQLLAKALGGQVVAGERREYGAAKFRLHPHRGSLHPLWSNLNEEENCWMSHGDQVHKLPPGFHSMASTDSALAAMGDDNRKIYALQFHPEVSHTPCGNNIIVNFLRLAGCQMDWTSEHFIARTTEEIRQKVGQSKVACALSGGVDSTVAAALVHRAIGSQLRCFFVDNGLLRQGEAEQVMLQLQALGLPVQKLEAQEQFFGALAGVSEPEQKRKIIGKCFIDAFDEALRHEQPPTQYLVQGTLYPDVVESGAGGSGKHKSHTNIKTHHNVGGLPAEMNLRLLEPLRQLFKDEVRRVGLELQLPPAMLYRQPFPGPGLAVRVLGEVTPQRVQTLQQADLIIRQELDRLPLEGGPNEKRPWQYFGVLLPVKTVGVMGDQRTYADVVALRAVHSEDAMTAGIARLNWPLLETVASRIVNEVPGVNRVVYDITSKPPGTIEWE